MIKIGTKHFEVDYEDDGLSVTKLNTICLVIGEEPLVTRRYIENPSQKLENQLIEQIELQLCN